MTPSSTPEIALLRGEALDWREIDFYSSCTEWRVSFIGRDIGGVAQYLFNQGKGHTLHQPCYRTVWPWVKPGGDVTSTSEIALPLFNDLLQRTDVLNAPEVYSCFSAQAVREADRLGKFVAITVYETLQKHITRWLPPYATNIRRVIQRANLFLPVTERAAVYLQSIGVPSDRIEVLSPGIRLDRFVPVEDSHEGCRILFVGRLVSEKGVRDLLMAFTQASRNDRRLELWICGGGPLQREVEIAARSLPIRYLGYVPRHNLPTVYSHADIFVLPSRYRIRYGLTLWEEQFGFALVEAMAAGLPIVATTCGAIPEVIGPDNYLVSQGDIPALTRALIELSSDAAVRKELGRYNRIRAEERFDACMQAHRLEQILKRRLH